MQSLSAHDKQPDKPDKRDKWLQTVSGKGSAGKCWIAKLSPSCRQVVGAMGKKMARVFIGSASDDDANTIDGAVVYATLPIQPDCPRFSSR